MKLYLTEGMFGKKIKQISTESDVPKTILEKVFNWVHDKENMKNYRMTRYNRFISHETEIAIDFGDYSFFLLIDGVNSDQMKMFFTA